MFFCIIQKLVLNLYAKIEIITDLSYFYRIYFLVYEDF
nr:MAG TPA: hypothetical protein [Caudoviricetes sp.]